MKLLLLVLLVAIGDECLASSSTEPLTDSTVITDPSTDSMVTTEPQTTYEASSASPPEISRFVLKNSNTNETCIILELNDQIHVQYETNDNKTVFAKVLSIPKDAKVSGDCLDSNASLVLSYKDDSVEFQFTDNNTNAKLDMIIYSVKLDKARFPNARNQNKTVELNATVTDIMSKDTTFFKCIAEQRVTFADGESNITLSNLQVQAFNLNVTFTGTGDECAADKTSTMAPVTTPLTTATTAKPKPADPTVNNYTVPGEHCILIRTGLILTIPYVGKTENTSVAINVPSDADGEVKTTGSCNFTATSQMIKLSFFKDWSIEFIFTESPASVEAAVDDKKTYSLENVTLMYTEDAEHFPNIKTPGAKKTLDVHQLDDFKVMSDQKSYKCKSKTDIKFEHGVDMTTVDFQYRAFFMGNSTDFDDSGVNECSADSDSNSVVPIAVGAALAGLVVIVLIAYLIGRRRSKRTGYESV